MMERINVWSCGGGTQSAAIAALIVQGRLPKPEYSIVVDTERERTSTWEYVDGVLIPELAKVGVELVRVPKSKYATVDLFSLKEGSLLIPTYTTLSGAISKLRNFCSFEWKRYVIMRYLRDQGVKACFNWLGISTDELRRVRTGKTNWFRNHYPLVYDIPMNRGECIALVKEMGWPKPHNSSCWMCPNMPDHEWLDIKENNPEDFERAVQFEREIREVDPYVYLHPQAVPLDRVDWSKAKKVGAQLVLGCDSGHCFS
jgi:hypothetical protein